MATDNHNNGKHEASLMGQHFEIVNARTIFESLRQQTGLHENTNDITEETSIANGEPMMCVICYEIADSDDEFFNLQHCGHAFCVQCLKSYLTINISESRIALKCPRCPYPIHPNDIQSILHELPELMQKYEVFSLRRYLAVLPDTRWCPAPDCDYAVIATDCDACPKLVCKRPECQMEFCYICRLPWTVHLETSCGRVNNTEMDMNASSSPDPLLACDETPIQIKKCPGCRSNIIKANDWSCNHMVCAVCNTNFCWLCLNPITDRHFYGSTGCTFFGKKIWSKKRRLFSQLVAYLGSPLVIAAGAIMVVPAAFIAFPIIVRSRLSKRYRNAKKVKRLALVTLGTAATVVTAPVIVTATICLAVPAALVFTCSIVPISLLMQLFDKSSTPRGTGQSLTRRNNACGNSIDSFDFFFTDEFADSSENGNEAANTITITERVIIEEIAQEATEANPKGIQLALEAATGITTTDGNQDVNKTP